MVISTHKSVKIRILGNKVKNCLGDSFTKKNHRTFRHYPSGGTPCRNCFYTSFWLIGGRGRRVIWAMQKNMMFLHDSVPKIDCWNVGSKVELKKIKTFSLKVLLKYVSMIKRQCYHFWKHFDCCYVHKNLNYVLIW